MKTRTLRLRFREHLTHRDSMAPQEQNLGRNAMLSWTRVWTPTFLTETRLAFSRLGDGALLTPMQTGSVSGIRHWRAQSDDVPS